jgi:hypothetical protein
MYVVKSDLSKLSDRMMLNLLAHFCVYISRMCVCMYRNAAKDKTSISVCAFVGFLVHMLICLYACPHVSLLHAQICSADHFVGSNHHTKTYKHADKKHTRKQGKKERENLEAYLKKVAIVYELYQSELDRSNAVDFDDLLLKTKILLDTCPHVREGMKTVYLTPSPPWIYGHFCV